jgi:demethylmenaquinone methyltransferase/2-methoxy-6-polyprenyl-1,4-benzoquinol methylase
MAAQPMLHPTWLSQRVVCAKGMTQWRPTPHEPPLYRLLNQVTPHYDLLNRTLTVGLDQRWRRRAARVCLSERPARVLDVCCGTADLALLLAEEADSETEIVAVDFSETMTTVARRKMEAKRCVDRISLTRTDVSELRFAEGYYEAIAIAFAFRNITFRNPIQPRCLAEIHRVLAPEGRSVIVETSQPRRSLLRGGFHQYMKHWSAPVDGVISGHRGAYRYLSLSVRKFVPPEGVLHLLEDARFKHVEYTPLLGGVAGIHVAWRRSPHV